MNLAGDYSNSIVTPVYLTTGAINCAAYHGVKLGFWRWLGVQGSSSDRAFIEVSNDGVNWTNVWSNTTSTLSESAWTYVEYNISAVADHSATVFVRWGLGPTNSSVTYPGWNIDDIEFTGFADSTPGLFIEATDTTAAETNSSTATFTVRRSQATANAAHVTTSVTGTATNGVDYVKLGPTVVIPAGQLSATVTITPVDDAIREGNETVIVTIAPPGGYELAIPVSATATISDNDQPTISVSSFGDSTTSEATLVDPGTFTFTRTGSSSAAANVNYAIAGTATPGGDYAALPGVVVIPAGQTSATVSVAVIDDALLEGSETVQVTIQANGVEYLIGTSGATVTITDDEQPVVSIVATDDAAMEAGATTGQFTITRTAPFTAALPVSVTIGGTATSVTDYAAITSPITIPAGQASAVVTVTPVNDAAGEGPETVLLTLIADGGNPLLYKVGSPASATVTIQDDDLPTVTVAATDPNAAEAGLDTGAFTFTRTGPTAAPLTVSYSNFSGTAFSSSDYTSLSGSIVIPAGASSATLTITPVNDTTVEARETVIVSISVRATLYAIGDPASATVFIEDDEPTQFSLEIADNSLSEGGASAAEIKVVRKGLLTPALTANLSYAGTAVSGTDYPVLTNALAMPAGGESVSIIFTALEDALTEGTETIEVTLGAGAGYTLGTTITGNCRIADNETTAFSVINVDLLASAGDTVYADDRGLFSTAGGTKWNGLAPNAGLVAQRDQNDAATTVEVEASTGSAISTSGGPPYSSGFGATILNIFNLDPAKTYDVVLYFNNFTGVIGSVSSAAPDIVKTLTFSRTRTMPGAEGADSLVYSSLTPAVFSSGHRGFQVFVPTTSSPLFAALQIREHTAGNTAPVISDIADLTFAEDSIGSTSFTIGDAQSPANALALSATSSNPGLIPNGNITFSGSISRFAVISPTPGQSGTSTISVTVSDGVLTRNDTFVVTVTPDAPLTNWRQVNFGADWTNPAISSDLVDTDADGDPTIAEYAHGGNPNQSSQGQRPTMGVVGGKLAITFTRVLANTDIDITVEAADSVNGPWTDIASSTAGGVTIPLIAGVNVSETGAGATRTVQVVDEFAIADPAHPARYLRVRVNH